MNQERIDKDGIRLRNAESFILELVLLAYPLVLISENLRMSPHYLIIALAIISGIGLYMLFPKKSYSTFKGLVLSFLIACPFYVIGLPVAVVILILFYVSWRMHINFGPERSARWNFLTLNMVVFTLIYLLARIYLVKHVATELNKVNIIVFLLTSVLFFVLRYIGTILLGRHSSDLKIGETNKIFAAIFGIGFVTFFSVYFFVVYIRTAIINFLGFVFGGLFYKLAATFLPTINQFKLAEGEKAQIGREFPEHALNEGTSISMFFVFAVVALAFIFLITLLIVILRKRIIKSVPTGQKKFTIRSLGRQNKRVESTADAKYDYSRATNAVRIAYQNFENDAMTAKYPRYSGETVKEWFRRMGWARNENVFWTYDKARYGSNSITEEEGRQFVKELENIKIDFFSKD